MIEWLGDANERHRGELHRSYLSDVSADRDLSRTLPTDHALNNGLSSARSKRSRMTVTRRRPPLPPSRPTNRAREGP
jgi:hypothetical protein